MNRPYEAAPADVGALTAGRDISYRRRLGNFMPGRAWFRDRE